MRKMDYHVHSLHSYDGIQSIEEMCKTMISLGVQEVCLTEHFDLDHPDDDCQGIPDWETWSREIQYVNQKYPNLMIKRGIEVGDNPKCRDQIKSYVSSLSFDFVLLSLHLVDNQDPYHKEVFFKNKTREECYVRYLESVMDEVLHYDDYDSLAHLGYIGRYAPWNEKAVQHEDAPEIVDCILKHLIEHDKCLEINTKGIDHHFIPVESIIRRYIELGGNQFTFGSDAHIQEHDYRCVDEAKDFVKRLGGKYQAGFTNRNKELYLL